MKKTLFFLVIILPSITYSQDTLIKFGGNSSLAPTWKYLGGGTNLDAVSWKTTTYNDASWISAKSALGFGTNPPRNTAIPQDNSAGGGGVSGARYTTLYFRKLISITNPSSYRNFKLRTRFDDAIVVWINGTEAFRNNIIANPAYATTATAGSSNSGADIYAALLNPSLFVNGNNIIAVEVHQQSAASGDLYFDLELVGYTTAATGATARQPYLQAGSQTATTIRWTTDVAGNSRIRCGTSFGTYNLEASNSAVSTAHEVRITGLQPDTKYFYEIGEYSGATFYKQQGSTDNYFTTLPPPSATRKITLAAFGDCGANDPVVQANTLTAFRNYIGYPAKAADAMLLIGDNAYDNGTASEFENHFFGVYGSNILKNTMLYPIPGNHDYANLNSNKTVRTIPYYTNFTMPANAESGGVASGTEAYYSFDIGDVHVLMLDSYGVEGTKDLADTTGAQAVWIKADLAATAKKWIVALLHHPPYTFGSHESDVESDLQQVRDRVMPILERYGVDIVLAGHSHSYERSYLMKGLYANSSSFVKSTHVVDTSSAKYNGTANSCPYNYASGKYKHGTVYVVSGSAGSLSAPSALAPTFNNPNGFMPFSRDGQGGCFIIEVQGNRLDAKFLQDNGTIGDQFTIMKDVKGYTEQSVNTGTSVTLTASWPGGNYNWINNGNQTTNAITFTPPFGTHIYRVVDNVSGTCLKDSFRINVNAVLPVRLTDFNASAAADGNIVTWQTDGEYSNNYFSLERSVNGVDFILLKNITAEGNSNGGIKKYNYTDAAAPGGVCYYRLSQTDNSGSKHYLGIKKVTRNFLNDLKLVQVFDDNSSKLIIKSPVSFFGQMHIVNMQGAVVNKQKLNCVAGDNTIYPQVPAGIYIIQVITTDGKTAMIKFSKSR